MCKNRVRPMNDGDYHAIARLWEWVSPSVSPTVSFVTELFTKVRTRPFAVRTNDGFAIYTPAIPTLQVMYVLYREDEDRTLLVNWLTERVRKGTYLKMIWTIPSQNHQLLTYLVHDRGFVVQETDENEKCPTTTVRYP